MDIDDDGGNEKILDRVKATCQNEVKRLLRKEEAKQRKKSGARGNVPPRKPGNGQSTVVTSTRTRYRRQPMRHSAVDVALPAPRICTFVPSSKLEIEKMMGCSTQP